ncbi:MAG TPA: ABC transporter ATP-binding protein [candidate division Zixibacteria bacterium]|nr:ABC transporter ATP-binding protein [candidate division Zixibacteria bacterium]HEQ97748.1 ABC transporter ATP-binding protein [candidate division Zixibacteria bacterium]
MAAIEIKNLKKHFGPTRAVDGISFDVEKKEIFGFLGPNGAGKTTTIRCMMDFIRPTDGSVSILGIDSRGAAVELKNKIGYLPGTVRLYDKWTGEDHIDYVRRLRKCNDNARDMAKFLDLDISVKTRHLSLGNSQKLGLILALMGDPEILVLDEPTLGLDPLFQDSVYELLKKANSEGKTIFMSSHYLGDVERICDRVEIIKEGKLVAAEGVRDLKQKRIYKVQAFFAGSFDRNAFEIEGVEITSETSESLSMDVKGDINPLIARLGNFELRDLQIEHASLKDIFLEFYEKR